MFGSLLVAVIVGLAVGIGFIVVVSFIMTSQRPSSNVKLSGEWDEEGQKEAVEILLDNARVRAFVAGGEFEVVRYQANFPQPSVKEGICGKGECKFIQIAERNSDGSMDCDLKTLVNTETGQIDELFQDGFCDRRIATPLVLPT